MKYIKPVILLLILVMFSLHVLSPTLARFSSENSGSDTAVIAKWNFRVGADEDNLHNEGFTFDVFNEQPLKPQDMGENSFFISPGESDVAIDYEVYMNVDVLLADINGVPEGTDYPPLIFRISSSETATVHSPYDEWFDLKNIAIDDDGYFSVATGHFDTNSEELVPITIEWWWNTSFYVGSPNLDNSSGGNYYKLATDTYQILIGQYNARIDAANSFFEQHQRTVTIVDEEEQVSYDCGEDPCPITEGAEGGDIDAAHLNVYNGLRAAVNTAQNEINNSLKVQYDNYDNKALTAIGNLQPGSAENILIKVVGQQVAPGQM